jgi:DNA-binding NarL/FixJ family response regulator
LFALQDLHVLCNIGWLPPGATSESAGPEEQDVAGTINLFIVDGQTLLRRALSSLIAAQQEFAVVGEAEDVSEAEPLLPLLQPHVVIVNLDSAEMDAEGAVGSILTRIPGARVIGLTSRTDPQAHARTIGAGAAGIVDKRHEPEVLFKAIRKVHAGELWLARYDMAAIVSGLVRLRSEDAHEASKVATLTRREHEIIACIAEGLRNRQVGERLFISEATVRNHVSSILDKLDLSDRLELVLYAFSHGLAKTPQHPAGLGPRRETADHRKPPRRPGERRRSSRKS